MYSRFQGLSFKIIFLRYGGRCNRLDGLRERLDAGPVAPEILLVVIIGVLLLKRGLGNWVQAPALLHALPQLFLQWLLCALGRYFRARLN
jgi:hypothetical protein